MKFKLSLGIVALAFTLSPARATSIVYEVDFAIGTDTVTGEITTNGDTGYLTSSDIRSWSFLLNDSDAFSSTGSNQQVILYTTSLEATATEISIAVGADEGFQFCSGPGSNSCEENTVYMNAESANRS